MSSSEHPKSAVYRITAQNPKKKFTTISVDFLHEHSKSNNKNYFKCVVSFKIDDDEYKVTSNTHQKFLSKKDAEYDAFSQILIIIKNQYLKKLKSVKSSKIIQPLKTTESTKSIESTESTKLSEPVNTYALMNVVIIIDFENMSKANDLTKLLEFIENKNKSKQISIIKVAGYCSSMKTAADIVVRSNRKDAVDHYISYFIGILEANNPSPKIYVVTRDKFASCLQDFCKNVHHCSDVDDFINMYSHVQ